MADFTGFAGEALTEAQTSSGADQMFDTNIESAPLPPAFVVVPVGATKVGSEFLVNTESAGNQLTPTITGLSNGGFVVTWRDSSGTLGDASATSVKAQVFDAAGAKVGSEFLVNTQTALDQISPTITGLSNGGFVVAWRDTSGTLGDASGSSIKAQVFDAAGAKLGSEFLVNTQTAGNQSVPTIDALANGGFVVTWSDTSGTLGDASNNSIKAQVFNAGGAKVGSEFLVNTQTFSDQYQSTITGLANGGFVVTWSDNSGTLGDADGGVKAQVFDAFGAKLGSEFLVNTQTAGAQYYSTITGLANGGFVVTWSDGGGSGSVKAQVFDAAGGKLGGEFRVDTSTTSNQQFPTITGLNNGGFVVTWTDSSGTLGDASGASVKAQVFDATGTKVGSEFLVNTQTGSDQLSPTITGLTNGGFVVTWRDTSGTLGDASGTSIKAQIFSVAAPNAAPTISNLQGDVSTQTEGVSGTPRLDVGSNAVINDLDSANFDGGTLTVAVTAGFQQNDNIGILQDGNVALDFSTGAVSVGGVVIGTATGGYIASPASPTFSVSLNGNATPALVQTLLRAIFIRDPRVESRGGTREITTTLSDGDGGVNSYTSQLVVTAINDEPSGTDKTITINEDSARTLTVADFGFLDTTTPFNFGEGDSLAAVFITTLPTGGKLYIDTDGAGTGALGTAVIAGQRVTAAQLNAGQLVYVPAANANGAGAASFTFQVQDNNNTNGTGPGSQDTDQSPNTLTFNVTAVNDAPVANPDSFATSEDTPVQFSIASLLANDTDADGDPVRVTGFGPAQNGTYYVNSGIVTFTPNQDFVGAATLDYTITDDNGGTSVGRATIAVSAVNDAPVVDLNGAGAGIDTTASYTENAAAVKLTPAITLSDVDNTTLAGATATIASGFVAGDVLRIAGGQSGTTADGITYSFNASTGVLTLSGTASVAAYQAALATLAFKSSSDTPGTSRDITVTVSDGTTSSLAAHVAVAVTPVNDAPNAVDDTVSFAATGAVRIGYYDMSAGQGVDQQIEAILGAGHTPVRIFDLSDAELASIDILLVQNPDNGTYPAEYLSRLTAINQAVSGGLQLIIHDRYVDGAETILPGSTGFDIVRDFSDDARIDFINDSHPVTNGPGGPLDDASLDQGGSSSHGYAVRGSLPVGADFILSRNDPDQIVTFSYQYRSGNVVYSTIPLDYYLGNDTLGTGGNNIDGKAEEYLANLLTYVARNVQQGATEDSVTTITTASLLANDTDPEGDPLTVTAVNGTSAQGATVTLAGGNIAYDPTGAAAIQALQAGQSIADTFTYTVSDGNGGTDTATVSLTVNGVNDAPVVDLNGAAAGINTTAAYTENAAAVKLAPAITLRDVDNTTLTGATATIASGFVAGDVLRLNGGPSGTTADGITYSFNASTGVLTLSGTASVAAYQAALATLAFKSSSDDPGTSRDIVVTVTDGAATSAAARITLAITPVNDAPVNSVPGDQTINSGSAIVFSSANGNALSVSDPDAGGSAIRVKVFAEHGTLTLSGTNGLTVTGDGTGLVIVVGTLAAINSALNGLSYRAAAGYTGSDTLGISTNDQGANGQGGQLTDYDSVAISILPASTAQLEDGVSEAAVGFAMSGAVSIDPSISFAQIAGNADWLDSSVGLPTTPTDVAGIGDFAQLRSVSSDFYHIMTSDFMV